MPPDTAQGFHARPHRRHDPLMDEWILVSPHRLQRPWQGQMERSQAAILPAYVSDCYLCPGNTRANGATNPSYHNTYVFPNDFAALLPPDNLAETVLPNQTLLRSVPEHGLCRVICYSPRHDLTLSRMTADQIIGVVNAWSDQSAELAARPDIAYVQLFENRGESMGCSNPHPHGQVWATGHLPTIIEREDTTQRIHAASTGKRLLESVLNTELDADERIVLANDHWVVLVPFWARWPYETMVLPRRSSVRTFADLTPAESSALAEALKNLTTRYDNLFQTSFPYTMGWHQAPCDGRNTDHWTLHAHFYPPLLRSASVRKFMVGYEMLCETQRDITPEHAAARLKSLSNDHYLDTEI